MTWGWERKVINILSLATTQASVLLGALRSGVNTLQLSPSKRARELGELPYNPISPWLRALHGDVSPQDFWPVLSTG